MIAQTGVAVWRARVSRVVLVAVMAAPVLAAVGWVGTANPSVDAVSGDELCPNLVVNGGFEEPLIAEAFENVDVSLVPGWTADGSDGLMELWRAGTNRVDAPEGSQFAELDVNAPTAISQTFEATVDGQVQWSFQHRGTEATDTVVLTIGAMEETLSAPAGEWTTHTGTVEVSAGPVSLTLASGSPDGSVGNLIDAVSVRGLCTPPDGELAAVDDSFGDPEQDGSSSGNVAENDVLPAGADVEFSVSRPPAGGYLQMWPDGEFVWVPDDGGTDSFDYQVCLGDVCSGATVTVEASDANDAPVARDDYQTDVAAVGEPFLIDVLANDDEGEPGDIDYSSLQIIDNPAGAEIRIVGDGLVEVQLPSAEQAQNPLGIFRIRFTYQICDIDAACDNAEVFIDGANPTEGP